MLAKAIACSMSPSSRDRAALVSLVRRGEGGESPSEAEEEVGVELYDVPGEEGGMNSLLGRRPLPLAGLPNVMLLARWSRWPFILSGGGAARPLIGLSPMV